MYNKIEQYYEPADLFLIEDTAYPHVACCLVTM